MMVPPFDILAEHAQCQGLTEAHMARFREQGVPAKALIKSALGGWSMLARDHVVFMDDGRFEFARHIQDGEPVGAFIWPAHDQFGDIVDMIAWRPSATVATWLWRVGLAGQELVQAPRIGEPALRVFEYPIEWLRSGREGVLIVDPIRAAPLLRQAGPLAVGTVAERRKLEALLTVRAPRIEVVSGQVAPIEAKVAREINRDNISVDLDQAPKSQRGTRAYPTVYNVHGWSPDILYNIQEEAL